MKRSTIFRIAVFSLLMILVSCNKYEQGPKFTLLTAKMRVINNWNSSSYSVNSTVGSLTTDHMSLSIKRDGSYIAEGTHLGFNDSSIGTWEFDLDKTHLLLDYNGDITKWKITRLKNKSMNLVRIHDLLGVETTTAINFEGG